MDSPIERIALVKWQDSDGVADAIQRELQALGCQVVPFRYDAPVPWDVDMVLTFAPYNRWLPIARQVGMRPAAERPLLVHWHTEGIPNPSLPLACTRLLGSVRSWLDRLNDGTDMRGYRLLRLLLQHLNPRWGRYRYLGDYLFAHKMGWLDILADFSETQAAFFRLYGIPAVYVPWGTSPEWWADLHLERDIDVLWMGQQRNRRRTQLIERVSRGLSERHICMHTVDGVQNPFVFGLERTRLLNRAKLTLNLATARYMPCFIVRFHFAAGNRCLVVSEPFLMHSAEYRPGVHYVEAEVDALVDTVLYYLEHEEERAAIAENAFQLVTTRLTLRNSVEKLLQVAEERQGDQQ